MRPAALRLWFGRTMHRREKPFVRAFSYPVAMVDIDIDRLDEAADASRLFSVNRANAIAFLEADHGARNGAVPLRTWAEALFAEAGVWLEGGAIRLLSFPRVMGHGFSPISVWFGHGPDGALRGVIYEVRNTFGEAHAYVTSSPMEQHEVEKQFFVSPFFDVSGSYCFRLQTSEEKLQLVVENQGADGRAHVASLSLEARPVSDSAILNWLTKMPFSGLGVVLAIHWQALILFLKGLRYHIRPRQLPSRTTLARASVDNRSDMADGRDGLGDLRKRA